MPRPKPCADIITIGCLRHCLWHYGWVMVTYIWMGHVQNSVRRNSRCRSHGYRCWPGLISPSFWAPQYRILFIFYLFGVAFSTPWEIVENLWWDPYFLEYHYASLLIRLWWLDDSCVTLWRVLQCVAVCVAVCCSVCCSVLYFCMMHHYSRCDAFAESPIYSSNDPVQVKK